MASGEGELELGSQSDLDVMFVCFGETWPFWGLRYYVDSLSGGLFKRMCSKQGLKKFLLTWFALMRLDDDVILRWCMLAQIRVRSLIHSLSVLIATVLLQVFF